MSDDPTLDMEERKRILARLAHHETVYCIRPESKAAAEALRRAGQVITRQDEPGVLTVRLAPPPPPRRPTGGNVA